MKKRKNPHKPVDSDMLLSLISLLPGTPRPSELDFFLSLLHHFQSGWALKWASFTYQEKKWWKKIYFKPTQTQGRSYSSDLLLWRHLCTWKAKSWYFCFSFGPRAYHHSPRILLTVLLSWFGCRWCTKARWRLLKIMKAFIGRRMWSFSFWKRKRHEDVSTCSQGHLMSPCLKATFPGLFLSPSLGSALRDWVRLFTGDVERGGSGTTPGRKLEAERTVLRL